MELIEAIGEVAVGDPAGELGDRGRERSLKLKCSFRVAFAVEVATRKVLASIKGGSDDSMADLAKTFGAVFGRANMTIDANANGVVSWFSLELK